MASPRKKRIAVYYRVSTEDQTLSAQKHEVKKWLEYKEISEPLLIYQDHGISGAKDNRPGLDELLSDCRKGKIGTVIVYKLDRLTRNTSMAVRTILLFDDLGIQFVSVSQPHFSHDAPFRHTMITLFAELAQMERENIAERVKSGMAAAKEKGVKFGAPIKATPEKISEIVELREQELSLKKISKRVGLSVGTVHNVLKAAQAVKSQQESPQ